MTSIVDIEWRNFYEDVLRIIVDEFHEGKELITVILLIIAKDAEVLLEDLINTLDLAVRLWVIYNRLITLMSHKSYEGKNEKRDD